MVDTKTGGKRKQTGYNKFVQEWMKKHPKGASEKQTDRMKKAGAAWRGMSDAEKKKY